MYQLIQYPSMSHDPQAQLEDIVVRPRSMNTSCSSCIFPDYDVIDGRTGEEYAFCMLISGGRDPDQPVVTGYSRTKDRYNTHVLVLKMVPPLDDSHEEYFVPLASYSEVMVPAHIARAGESFVQGGILGPQHYTVVVMHHAGDSLHERVPLPPCDALRTTLSILRSCRVLQTLNLAYVDLKPCNVMTGGLSPWAKYDKSPRMCDYGAMDDMGSTRAAATYPPPEYPRGLGVLADEHTMAHGLGVFLIALVSHELASTMRFVTKATVPDDEEAREGLRRAHEEAIEQCSKTHPAFRSVLEAAFGPQSLFEDVEDAILELNIV